jgi:Protein of unknown function (DUF3828)
MPMPFNRWMLLLITTGWHARARLHPLLLACAFLALAGSHVVYAADRVTPAPAATPEAAVRLFYPWYLGEMMQGRVPLTEERMQDYVSEDTLRDIAFMMKRPNGGKPGLQEDYFLQAKDYFDDWADYIAVSQVTIDGDTASALVALGDPAQGTQRLALTLVREDGGWKISRVNKAAASK